LNVECKALYLFLLKGGQFSDLFCISFSTAKNRSAGNTLNAAVSRAVDAKSTVLWREDWITAVQVVYNFVEKFAIGCNIKLCDEFKPER
jgi:hypothetical protein